MSANQTINLVFVVNGDETPVNANLHAPLRVAAQHALNESGNRGRPLEDWELKDEQGKLLNLDRKVGEFGFTSGTVLYLSLRVGVNGDDRDGF